MNKDPHKDFAKLSTEKTIKDVEKFLEEKIKAAENFLNANEKNYTNEELFLAFTMGVKNVRKLNYQGLMLSATDYYEAVKETFFEDFKKNL